MTTSPYGDAAPEPEPEPAAADPLDDPEPPPSEPSPAALDWAFERLAKASPASGATVRTVRRLDGGSHASTHLLETDDPEQSAVLRRFGPGDDAAAREARVLDALDGLDGFAPRLLGADPHGERCGVPAVLISRLPGWADITPDDPERAAAELGRALARLHAVPGARLTGLRDGMAAPRSVTGPAAVALAGQRDRLAAQPRVLTHFDYWSGNVLWREGALTGVVDWSGAGLAPRGFDIGWLRLDLALLHGPDTTTVDTFTAAYRTASGVSPPDAELWDLYSVARGHRTVETWVPNYADLGRLDLDAAELRRRHTGWSERCLDAVRP
ncbi:aminoglycoside phosphotransferase family protein [Streptomyces sp. AJS327]|uniref:phosphotransferase family protein n=1 Tax=Streptomyces sp. AJS327 TaxID=2545265 RepID=UPI0015E01139|nr:phosphotransferase [Streptomyces sp. AJS327]MBA0053786.1 aminoglycoside phosphotransferase family protein [Streptomyces sp. AJS327]